MVDLTGDEAFETPEDVLFREPLGESPLRVGDRGLVVAESADRDHVEGGVGLSITAAVQTHPLGLAGGDRYRCDTTEPRERRLGMEPVYVLSGRDQQLGCVTGADRELGDQRGRRSGDKILQHDVDITDLDGEVQDSPRERAERVLGGMEWVLDVVTIGSKAGAALDQRGGGALGDLFSQLSRCCDE